MMTADCKTLQVKRAHEPSLTMRTDMHIAIRLLILPWHANCQAQTVTACMQKALPYCTPALDLKV